MVGMIMQLTINKQNIQLTVIQVTALSGAHLCPLSRVYLTQCTRLRRGAELKAVTAPVPERLTLVRTVPGGREPCEHGVVVGLDHLPRNLLISTCKKLQRNTIMLSN